jgi:hypothetical protein
VKAAAKISKTFPFTLKNATLIVEVMTVPQFKRTSDIQLMLSALLTVLMDILKISTTFVFPLSFATPLAAASAKPTMIPPNAQPAPQLLPHHFPHPHSLTTPSLRLENAPYPPPTTPDS